jgi:hypothetical protein
MSLQEEHMAQTPNTAQAAAMWTWSAVAGGVVASLIIQAMLTMLALGVGLVAVDLPTAANAPITVSTAALLWWVASGIFAAFVGGAVAGAYAPVTNDKARVVHAVAAWAIASLIVLGTAAASTGGTANVVSNMANPAASVSTRLAAVNRPAGQATPALTAAQIEEARKIVATAMFAGFVGLIAGAVAAAAGGWWSRKIADEIGVPTGATRAGASTR